MSKINLFTVSSIAWNTIYQVLKRKGTYYETSGFFSLIPIKEFPLPTAYEALLKDSLEPFFSKIKY